MRTTNTIFFLALSMLLFMTSTTIAQVQQTNDINIHGESSTTTTTTTTSSRSIPPTFDPELLASLRSAHSGLTEQYALDIAEMITAIKNDPESMKLLEEMKQGTVQKDYEELKRTLNDKEIIEYMVLTLDEIKAIEVLFTNPTRAFEEMKNEGMIPSHLIEVYAQNPKLLENDTRKGLFFSMLSLAAAGGYL